MMKAEFLCQLTFAAALSLFSAHLVSAQEVRVTRAPPGGPGPFGGPPPGEESAKMRMWIYTNLEKYLKLEEATSRKFQPLFNDYSDAREKLRKEHFELNRRIARDVEDESVPVADLKALSQRYKAIDRSLWQEREKFYKRSEKILDDRQMVKLIIFEDKVKEDLFRRFRGARRDGPPGAKPGTAPESEMNPVRIQQK